MSSQFFNIGKIPSEIKGCVYRLWYGDKYVIIKGKSFDGSVYFFKNGLYYYENGGCGQGNELDGRGKKVWDGANTFYHAIYTHIINHPGLNWQVELLFQSDNPYQLLKREQIELTGAIKDKRCLNSNITSYIPKYNSKTKTYGWVGKSHVLNFRKFLKRM